MSRKQKRKATKRARWGFSLNLENERDRVIHDALDELAYDDDASEFIRAALYAAVTGQRATQQETDPVAEAVQAMHREIMSKLDGIGRTLKRGVAVNGDAQPAEDDDRAQRAADKLKSMSFGALGRRGGDK